MSELWKQLADRASITLTQYEFDRFNHFLNLLLAANREMNLTRIDTIEQAQAGHVGDALTLLPFLPKTAFAIADVGSGGGVPGIPLAIARPDAKVTLIESTQKKAVFLERAVREIGLNNVSVEPHRAEDLARGPLRESFNVVAARALAGMNVLAEWCLPLVKVGGVLLAMKGGKIVDELPAAAQAIRLLGGGKAVVHPANLPGANFHAIVEIRKTERTINRYPRPASMTSQKPL